MNRYGFTRRILFHELRWKDWVSCVDVSKPNALTGETLCIHSIGIIDFGAVNEPASFSSLRFDLRRQNPSFNSWPI